MPQPFGLGKVGAVVDPVIGVALEGNVRVVPNHPRIQRIMEEKVGQQGADYTPLRRSPIPCRQGSIRKLHRGFQPPFGVEKNPRAVRVLAHSPDQKRMIDVIEEAFDVQIQHPVTAPAALPCRADGLDRGLAGAIPIGILVENWLQEWFQVPF